MNNAFIIHERPFNERRKYVLFFSEHQGVLSASLAMKTRLHYFNLYQTELVRNRIKLQHPIEHHVPFMGKKLYCALYINELIYRFCKPEDPHPSLFSHYQTTMSLLRENTPLEGLLRSFELNLLHACGYGFQTTHITSPYVQFCKHTGLVGIQEPSMHSISLQALNQMIYQLQPSPDVKRFLRHVLQMISPGELKSSLFYTSANSL